MASDADAVAGLHAESWRRHYRGAYADSFLDGDVDADRLAVWSARLGEPTDTTRTFLAEVGGEPIGFAHVILDADPHWGALLDNLHVSAAQQGNGIGSALLRRSASYVVDRRAGSSLYLWVLEQNVAAQAFYRSLNGEPADVEPVKSPNGVEGRLVGSPRGQRYVWRDPRTLIVRTTTAT